MAAQNSETPNTPEKEPIDILREHVDKIAKFIEGTSSETKEETTSPVLEKLIEEAEKEFNNLKEKCIIEKKGSFFYLMGKMYMSSPNHVLKAIDCLAKAVKLEPTFIDGWNDLGECYWVERNYKMAESCFQGALRQEKNKRSLRNLSIVLRKSLTYSSQNHFENIKNGVLYAKEAVEMDPSDGTSWTILGNAYLAAFFTFKESSTFTVGQALSAYKQAEKYADATKNPELFYNKGMALKYEENYKPSLDALERAHELDPLWVLAKKKLNSSIRYLENIKKLDQTKGKLRMRKIFAMVESLKKPSLGPYALEPKTHTEVLLENLTEGTNVGKIIVGKVFWSSQLDDSFPFTFGVIDKKLRTGVVTVYSMAPGRGVLIGDTVAIPDPVFNKIKFIFHDQEYDFLKIRLNQPVSLIVNNKQVPADYRGFSTLTTQDVY